MDEVIAWIFDTLEAGGLRPPWAGRETTEADRLALVALETWTALLGDQTPEALIRAAGGYLRSGDRFWPTPGALLALVPESSWAAPPAAALFEWVISKAARGWTSSRVLTTAETQWGLEVRRPLRAGLAAVGGVQGLGRAPIEGGDRQSQITRATLLKSWREAYQPAADRAAQTARTGIPEGAARQLLADLAAAGGRRLTLADGGRG